MDYNTIEFERQGHIGVLTLDRPDHLNAINLEMIGELRDCFTRLYDDFQTSVVVLVAKGRLFCAGIDLKMVARGWESQQLGDVQHFYHEIQQALADVVVWMHRTRQPIIAGVHGAAVFAFQRKVEGAK